MLIIIRRIFSIFSKKQKQRYLLIQLLMVFEAIIEVLGITSIVPFMAVASSPEVIHKNQYLKNIYTHFNFTSEKSFLIALGVIVLILLVVGNLYKIAMKWVTTIFGQNVGRYLGVRLFKTYLSEDYIYHTINNSSVLTTKIVLEVTRLTNNVLINLLTLNARLFTIFFILVGLLASSLLATAIMALMFGGSYGLIYFVIKRKLSENGIEMSSLSARRMQLISEGFGGIKELLIHGKEKVYLVAYDRLAERYAKITTYNMFFPVIPRYFLEIVSLGGIVTVIIMLTVQGGTISDFLPILSLYAMAGLKLLPALQQFFSSLTTLKANNYSLTLLFDDLTKTENREVRSLEKYNNPTIHVENICYNYPDVKENVLNGISLEIKPKESVAIVGSSGAGKSTLIDMILGLLKPLSGELKIDGIPVHSKKDTLEKWQNSVGYVPQTIYLLDASLAHNVAFSLDGEKIDMDRVKKVCSMAMLDEFINESPDGLGSFIGENGIQLSGGQRQRVGVARALYSDPSVLIFDEATSSLDNKTEKEIMRSIYDLSNDKTIVLIAHRLSTVKNCDTIYYLEDGKVTGKGTFDELLESNESFRKLATL